MKRKEEMGAVMIETALAVPILIMIIGITIDLSLLFISSLELHQIAAQGARVASKVSSIETGRGNSLLGESCAKAFVVNGTTYVTARCCSSDTTNCPTYNLATASGTKNSIAGHAAVLSRVYLLLNLQDLRTYIESGAEWYTPFTARLTYNATTDEVSVNITATHKFLWGTAGFSKNISSTAVAPYLY